MSEHETQSAFIQWCRFHENKYPPLKLAFSTPNAAKRSPATAGYMIAEGMRAGVWDWCMPYNNGKHNGLWIEFKYGKNKLTNTQFEYGVLLAHYGHSAHICYTVDEAIKAVVDYMKVE